MNMTTKVTVKNENQGAPARNRRPPMRTKWERERKVHERADVN